MAMVGAFLGWGYAWLTILLGSLVGALVGSLFILIFSKGNRYELPFGSFLAVGALAATLWGREVFSLYLSQF
jgi:leader peptidase (prepilin peptidase)/N-methyltransferase